jgi:hypothetical protein
MLLGGRCFERGIGEERGNMEKKGMEEEEAI